MPDPEVLDVFSRLNSYAVVLNEQEKINAQHFGPFKTLADEIAHSLNEFWLAGRILTEQQILRMADVTLVADLLIAMILGIKSKKYIPTAYSTFEKEFPYDSDELELKFKNIIEIIQLIFGERLSDSEFRRIHIFYTLFTVIYHLKYEIPGIPKSDYKIDKTQYAKIEMAFDKIDTIFATDDVKSLSNDEITFLADSRRATTDAPVRTRRTNYLLSLLN